jgi:hypothetical protein
MITKKEFFLYMSELYEETYTDSEAYRAYKEIINCTDKSKLRELRPLPKMKTKERLAYRHALAANGKELTPRQLDQYLSMIELALSNIE